MTTGTGRALLIAGLAATLILGGTSVASAKGNPGGRLSSTATPPTG